MHLYPFPVETGFPLPFRFFIYPVVIAVMAGIVAYYRKHMVFVFGVMFFLLNVSLTLHPLLTSRVVITADRYVYLSAVGFFMTVVWYGVKYFMQLSKYGKILICTVFFACFSFLTVSTVKRSEVWRDDDTLKRELRELLEQRKSSLLTSETKRPFSSRIFLSPDHAFLC